MTLSVDLFFSFRSPYSYLALPRTLKLVAEYDLAVNLRPVYPLAVRVPGFFKKASPQFARYVVLDSTPRRPARGHSVPLSTARPDRAGHDDARCRSRAALHPPPDPPGRHGAARRPLARIHRCDRRVLWDGSVTGWNEGDHLARAAGKAGFDLAAMDAAISADPDRYEQVIAENEKDHAASGHWGVPTFVFENEPFFGQDRIDLLVWRLQSKGLTKR